MMKHHTGTLLILISLILLLTACGSQTAAPEPAQTDIQATVDASVMATTTAEAALEQMVDEAVNEAMDEAMVELEAAADEAVAEALAEATPEPAYAAYSEEELVTAIEETAVAAETSTQMYSETAETAASDGQVTAEEAETIEYYVTISEETVDELEALIDTYYALYAESGDEIVAELVAIEEELNALNESIDEMTAVLDEINTTLEAGLELADETIAQLEQAAQEAQTKAGDISAQLHTWVSTAQINFNLEQIQTGAAQEDLSAILQNIQPNQAAGSYEEALNQIIRYADTANSALADGVISAAEMQNLAQMGANASASLTAQNIPGAEKLAGQINSLNRQMAAGNLSGAQAGLGNLQAQIPQIPSLPGGLGGSIPNPGGSIPRPGGG
jgi:hypothetical protein